MKNKSLIILTVVALALAGSVIGFQSANAWFQPSTNGGGEWHCSWVGC